MSKNKRAKFNSDTATEKPLIEEFLIVGIGASAGGVQALKEFFENVPAKSGLAFVVILHLSPDHDSQLAEVLQTIASIPVTQVNKQIKVTPNCVYVVPPNKHLTMNGNIIEVTPNLTTEDRRAPVDIFFRTLAESHKSRAVAVVLSGTGANGSMGLKRVKEKGGACFVQNPREAEFSEMPRNAIATDLVDRILNVREIPAHIITYKKSLGTIEIPVEPQSRAESQQQALREIFNILRLRTGHDFSNYKRPTILRRVERRINVHNLPDLPAYAAFIRENPDEAISLLKDLLISVTNFFRDKEPFSYLENEILPKIFDGKNAGDQVRIWVCGCATGEEAYSLAMLCDERISNMNDAPEVQIFATDIDEQALATAREGFYTLNDAADVSPERLRRYFNKEQDGYRIRRELREMILFAPHNLLKDPPFSHLDLVTCRNLLIYLNAAAQERVMETFHFALEPGCFMMLGNSETVDGAGDLFVPVSREHHIFQSRQVSTRIAVPVADTTLGSFRFEKTKTLQPILPPPERESRARISYGELHLQLLEQYSPSVVVNEEYEIVHLSANATGFMRLKGGELSNNLLELIRPELRLELRAALFQATQKKTNIIVNNLTIHSEKINLHIRPVLGADDTARGFILVLFEKIAEIETSHEILAVSPEPIVLRLEEELMRSKTQLRLSAEQFEAQTEELKASNEEHQAMNEELRSAMEELETSKEELQSVNEELVTVNQELKIKVEELLHSNNDLSNLISSTDIGTVFLDRQLRVKMFTPPAREIFNFIPTDLGRPLSDITNRLESVNLLQEAEAVLQSLQTIERESRLADGRIFLLRFSPYRTADEHIGGIVITSLDISRRNKDELNLRESEARFRSVFFGNMTAMGIWAKDGGIIDANDALLDLLGYSRAELIAGQVKWNEITPPEYRYLDEQALTEIDERGTCSPFEKEYVCKDGRHIPVLIGGSSFDEKGESGIFFAVDLTERKLNEKRLRESEQRFQLASAAVQSVIYDWNILTDSVERSDELINLLGFDPADKTTQTNKWFCSRLHPQDEKRAKRLVQKAVKNGDERFEDEFRLLHRDGYYVWVNDTGILLRDDQGYAVRCVGSITNITKRKEAEGILERYRLISERARDIVWLLEPNGKIIEINQAAVDTYGYTREELLEKNIADLREPSSLPMLAEHLRTANEGHTQFETAHVRKDGTTLPVEVSASGADFGGKRLILGIVRDVTERRRSEEALRESETRLRLALEASELATWVWHLETNEIFWNNQHFLLFGMQPRPNPVVPDDFFSHVHPDDRQRISGLLQKAITERSVFDTDFRAVLESGEIRWMSGFGRVVEEAANGNPVQMSGVMFDITDRKKAEENLRQSEKHLRESEERLRLLIESVEDYAIFTMTPEGIINSWNMGAEKIFGWTETEVIGQSAAIIFTPEDRKKGAPDQEMKTALLKGRAPDERFHIRKDGSRFYVSGVMTLLKDTNGKLQGFVKIARDMSLQRKAEKAFRDKEMLQKLVGAQEDERRRIARDLHDELGQKLTALRLKLEKARRMCEDEAVCAEIDHIDMLAKSIDDGVDFLAWELRPAALDQLGLIPALANYVRQWTLYSGVRAEFLSSSLKRKRFAREVETNFYRIAQEALNNINKHAEAKNVEIMLEKRGNLIVLIIQDDGKGFNAKDKKMRGKGIGLIGMQERAELIKGNLEIESAPGAGTTIFVRVPLLSVKKGGSDEK